MPYRPATVRAFRDEVEKIAGEMQGYTRIGRKPISIEKMLSNESLVTGLPDDFVKQSMSQAAKAAILLSLGAGGALTVQRANADRRMGRMIRRQQQSQSYGY